MAADTDYHIDPQSGRAVLTKKQNTGGICFMKMRSVVPMRIAKIGYIITSVLFCIVGILFIAMPEISTRIVGVGIGAVTIVFGIAKLIGYFSKDLYRLAFQFDLEFGIIMVVLGTIVLFHPENLMAFIAAAFGIAILFAGLIFESIMKRQVYFTEDGFFLDDMSFRYRMIEDFKIRKGMVKNVKIHFADGREMEVPRKVGYEIQNRYDAWKENKKK